MKNPQGTSKVWDIAERGGLMSGLCVIHLLKTPFLAPEFGETSLLTGFHVSERIR